MSYLKFHSLFYDCPLIINLTILMGYRYYSHHKICRLLLLKCLILFDVIALLDGINSSIKMLFCALGPLCSVITRYKEDCFTLSVFLFQGTLQKILILKEKSKYQ